ncbi:MAG: tRNA (guanosine(37)-N1)-methyltransferase TrmD [Candidatus Phytoplasma stylosanthis]|uniref:tRNA (guanosine(37)-N1)-methyltransferase TrmD n=1 Tax=Candidatus Phytoplasma stylosanthis TaxID=2798314 RepID=UPI00293B6359|nr:tRNA (guanosine(37)-N1)-methyltransferase TrmD [Candidatus Phytoplasma stylosanthis]MDV3170713.1 tRNA (guanosine(37)-N1)-methyltransferase TrmD [Candidatus Phytoplasma stylosanthis]MDV3173838.1 tRNA (guanosine(37)-N1)-methyltransferase TrmD [Candidatus Phytoplasma stylosanthis]MDV3173970.1 tRNA (guanosine(37)-N1)-methyltransferase TrmD [Candidatus Phytoplasma stylosanthis]MDV3202656.1 tRNA (guanosine(37)-N1)-methyltransferase TrmD [Candidatus Phytoplasma stylosanthis]
MKFDIITIFPHFFDNFINNSITKRALDKNKIQINLHDLRKYSQNKHHQIDDTPYGGGTGMLLSFPPFYECLKQIKKNNYTKVILLTPQGNLLNQKKVIEYSEKYHHLIILCGNYEGVDERILQYIDEEVSIGDYILTGGEIAAMILVNSITRILPGVIKKESYIQDSHQNGLLKYSQYTKPQNYKNHKVPSVLLSGDHQKIIKWRKKDSLRNTFLKRPELLNKIKLDPESEKLLKEIKKEKN